MIYYRINPATLTILSGPHGLMDTAIKQVTSCGNPDKLPNLANYGIVPFILIERGDLPGEYYVPTTGDLVVTAESVTRTDGWRAMTESERLAYLQEVWATRHTQRQTRNAERILAEPLPEDLPGLRRQLAAAKTLLSLRA